MNIIAALNPVWANSNHTAIDLLVDFDGLGVVPFTAVANDGIFSRALAGEFGAIAAYAAPVSTPEQVIANLTAAVQAHLDATARIRNYDGILSLCSYATSTNPKFGPEGLAGVAWRDAVWAACYATLAAVQAGTQAVPTEAQLLASLPIMTWTA